MNDKKTDPELLKKLSESADAIIRVFDEFERSLPISGDCLAKSYGIERNGKSDADLSAEILRAKESIQKKAYKEAYNKEFNKRLLGLSS